MPTKFWLFGIQENPSFIGGTPGFNQVPSISDNTPGISNTTLRAHETFSTRTITPTDHGWQAGPMQITITEQLAAGTHASGVSPVSYTVRTPAGATTTTPVTTYPFTIAMDAGDTFSVDFRCSTWWLSTDRGVGVGSSITFFGITNINFSATQGSVALTTSLTATVGIPGGTGFKEGWATPAASLSLLAHGASFYAFRSDVLNYGTNTYGSEFYSEFNWTGSFTATHTVSGQPINVNLRWGDSTSPTRTFTGGDTIHLTGTAPSMVSAAVTITITFTRTRNEITMPGATYCREPSLGAESYQLISPATITYVVKLTTAGPPHLIEPAPFLVQSGTSVTELTNVATPAFIVTGGFTGSRKLSVVCTSEPSSVAAVGFIVNGTPVTPTVDATTAGVPRMIYIDVNNNQNIQIIATSPMFDDILPRVVHTRHFEVVSYKHTTSAIPVNWVVGYRATFSLTTQPANVTPSPLLSSIQYVVTPGGIANYTPITFVSGLGTDSLLVRGAIGWIKLETTVNHTPAPTLVVYDSLAGWSAGLQPTRTGSRTYIENGNVLGLFTPNPTSEGASEHYDISFGCNGDPEFTNSQHTLRITKVADTLNRVPNAGLSFSSISGVEPGVRIPRTSTVSMTGFVGILEVSITPAAGQDAAGWTYLLDGSQPRYITSELNSRISVVVTPPPYPGSGTYPFGESRRFTVTLTPVNAAHMVIAGARTTTDFTVGVRAIIATPITSGFISFLPGVNVEPGQPITYTSVNPIVGYDGKLRVTVSSGGNITWSYALISAVDITSAMNLPVSVTVTPPSWPGVGTFPFRETQNFVITLTPLDAQNNLVVGGVINSTILMVTVRAKVLDVIPDISSGVVMAAPGQLTESGKFRIDGFDDTIEIYSDDSEDGGALIINGKVYLRGTLATVTAGDVYTILARAPYAFSSSRTVYVKQSGSGLIVVNTLTVKTKAGDDLRSLVDF